ncbi:hypothetical protein SCLCIDRAFT_1001215 [Scleroderma citrinum Foug A]|uniref:Uncharacterized protein n=1 Tax=Scleroderma citrinum Foug A TaxID=1036808 RepID=A0A0C3E5S1_9AGAM|nr:hypothetical protein SCLCIDRAFT_1001215 [Scleroderma citrinum Foug A]
MEKKNGSHAFHFLPPYLAVSFLRLCIDTNCTRSPLLLPYPMLFSPLPTWRLRGPGIRSFRPSPRRSLTIVHTASSGALLIWPFRGKHCGRVTCGHWANTRVGLYFDPLTTSIIILAVFIVPLQERMKTSVLRSPLSHPSISSLHAGIPRSPKGTWC